MPVGAVTVALVLTIGLGSLPLYDHLREVLGQHRQGLPSRSPGGLRTHWRQWVFLVLILAAVVETLQRQVNALIGPVR